MNIAIVYSTKHGTTQMIAERIGKELHENTIALFNLADHFEIDLSVYDTVIIGGSIHAGRLNRRVRKFLQSHTLELIQKRIALFMCGTNMSELENQFNKEFPALLRNHSISNQFVGGEFLFERMGFFDRLITQRITGIKSTTSLINQQAVDRLISDIKN
jgi:menaquinone-dependent protoporphyrinogen oxidase